MITAVDNQERNARTVAKRGACTVVGAGDSNLVPQLAETLATLLHDGAGRERMASAAAAITDGRGARRVALALRPETTRQGAPITLRRLTPDDGEQTYRWQQHPATRRYARNPSIPTWEGHASWIGEKLSDPGCVLDVIEVDGTPAGVVRLDRVARPAGDLACEVSIYTAPELAGCGVGTAALTALRRLAPEAVLLATVLDENAPSHALFSKAGYVLERGIYVSKPAIGPTERK
jgi:RimJ/RimL family protein N-acetyltransferase